MKLAADLALDLTRWGLNDIDEKRINTRTLWPKRIIKETKTDEHHQDNSVKISLELAVLDEGYCISLDLNRGCRSIMTLAHCQKLRPGTKTTDSIFSKGNVRSTSKTEIVYTLSMKLPGGSSIIKSIRFDNSLASISYMPSNRSTLPVDRKDVIDRKSIEIKPELDLIFNMLCIIDQVLMGKDRCFASDSEFLTVLVHSQHKFVSVVEHFVRRSVNLVQEENIPSPKEGTQCDRNYLKNLVQLSKLSNRLVVQSIIDLAHQFGLDGCLVQYAKVTSASCTLLIEVAGHKRLLPVIFPVEIITEKLMPDKNNDHPSEESSTSQKFLNAIANFPDCVSNSSISELEFELLLSISEFLGDVESIHSNSIVKCKKNYALRRDFHQQQWRGYSTDEIIPFHTIYKTTDQLSQTVKSHYFESDYESFTQGIDRKCFPIDPLREEARQNAEARRHYSSDCSIATLAEMRYLANDLASLCVCSDEAFALANKLV